MNTASTAPSHAAATRSPPTLVVLVTGLAVLLIGVGLGGTLIGVRGGIEGFPSWMLGVVVSGYYSGYVLGTFVCPLLIFRVGHIRTFAASAAVATATTLAIGLIVHPLAWTPLRFLHGFAIVCLYMVVESWLNEQTPRERRGRVFGSYTMVTLGALGLGQFLLLAGEPSTLAPFAIAALFVVTGLVPIAIVRVREPAPLHVASAIGLRALYANSPLAFQGVLVSGLTTSAFWGMGPVFAQRIGLDNFGIALLLAVTIAGGAALQWPIGMLSDKADRRLVMVGVSLAGGLVALLVPTILDAHPLIGTAAAFGYGGLMFTLYGIAVAHANDHADPAHVLDVTRGLLLIYGVGAIVGPIVIGSTMAGLGPIGMPIASGALLLGLGVFGLYRMTRRQAPPQTAQSEFVAMVRTSPAAVEFMPTPDEVEAAREASLESVAALDDPLPARPES